MTQSLPNGTRYVYYTETLNANGAYGAYGWSLAPYSNPLPPGFTLSPNGVISGYYTGQHTGTWRFTVRVMDQECPTGAVYQSLTLRIN